MSAAVAFAQLPPMSPVVEALNRFGFCAKGDTYTRGDLHFHRASRWAVLEQPVEASASDLPPDLGQPGLWRTVFASGRACRVFELPDSILALANDSTFSDDEDDVFSTCLAWALTTAEGRIPAALQPQPREVIEAQVPKQRLTILAGASVRQGELILSPQKFALQFPVVPTVAANLSAPRRQRLTDVLRETQSRWSLVRVGLAGTPDRASVLAEIDLTGAPAAALEPLLSASLDSLRLVVSRLVETAEVLTDASVASAALDSAAFLKPIKPSTKDQI
jgi:hypothetical protein